MRILLIENNKLLGEGLRTGLKQYRYTVDWVKTGSAAIQALQQEHFSTVIIDLEPQKTPYEEIIKNIRAKNIQIPVIVLTSKKTVAECVHVLDLGADDYLAKPFDLDELCARMRSLRRRLAFRAQSNITAKGITLEPATRIVHKDNKQVELSRREFALLHILLENAGRVLTREQLAQSIYGWSDDIDSNALEVHIHNLRSKFGTKTIKTIRGVGYMLVRSQ